MDNAAALSELGIDDRTLSQEQKTNLDRDGYIVARGLIPSAQCAAMRARLVEIADKEAANPGKDFQAEKGTIRLGALLNKDALFDICVFHPVVLASVARIFALTGEQFGLSTISSRAALTGSGAQALHADYGVADKIGRWTVDLSTVAATALWLIDPFTAENGPTRLVPGTHRSGKMPFDVMNPKEAHADEIRITAPAGTLLMFNSYLWHSGTDNHTVTPRHAISSFFSPRGNYQDFANRKCTQQTWDRLSPAARFVLDYPLDGDQAAKA